MNKFLNNKAPSNLYSNGNISHEEDLPVEFLMPKQQADTSERDEMVISAFANLWKVQKPWTKDALWSIIYAILNYSLLNLPLK